MLRRTFLGALASGTAGLAFPPAGRAATPVARGVSIPVIRTDEDVFAYLRRITGSFDLEHYKQILGAANAFKEGDQIVGVAAADRESRENARQLLANTRLQDIDAHPLHPDQLSEWLQQSLDLAASVRTADMTLGGLKQFLLAEDAEAIHTIAGGLSSQTIGCVVKLMDDRELIAVGAKVFNPLPSSQIGAKGYLGARIQPNSPTDHADDIRWQVFDGWSYAVGDVLLGTNPVSSETAAVSAIQRTLQDLLVTFGIEDAMPHCVLSHIDVQAEVEATQPGSTALWFQSLAGSDTANATFDLSLEKMRSYAAQRTGKYSLYFETGQGADFTNGHSHGFDMVLHESRKYGFARALKRDIAAALARAGKDAEPWVHLNDVAGFIGPEVFRTREQLVRCCLEDIVMGKLHGLCIGLDVCSTLHMDVSLSDLDWCLDQVMPANPAYLMALPTKIDPMLGYLTTGFQDHVRLRERFGFKVNHRMWTFFQRLGVIDQEGRPTSRFGDPLHVFSEYCRAKGDTRSDAEILAEGKTRLGEVRDRGIFIAEGHGDRVWDLAPRLRQDIQRIYADAKKSIWAELDPAFVDRLPNVVRLRTRSADRSDYILHPQTGEHLDESSHAALLQLRQSHAGRYDVQIVISDGLNALAIGQPGQLEPFLNHLRKSLVSGGYRPAPEHLVVTAGRVRVGYRIGETLFGHLDGRRIMLHIIGERPGTGHHTFSVYITAPAGSTWAENGKVDHNITKVVSGIATTALLPVTGAQDTVRVLASLVSPSNAAEYGEAANKFHR